MQGAAGNTDGADEDEPIVAGEEGTHKKRPRGSDEDSAEGEDNVEEVCVWVSVDLCVYVCVCVCVCGWVGAWVLVWVSVCEFMQMCVCVSVCVWFGVWCIALEETLS